MNYLDNIKKIRVSRGYSQEYMAEKLNIATVNYGKIERGITQMTIDKLHLIAQILETDIFLLLSDSANSSNNSIGFVRFPEIQKQLNSEINYLKTKVEDCEKKFNRRSDYVKLLKFNIEDTIREIERFEKNEINIKDLKLKIESLKVNLDIISKHEIP